MNRTREQEITDRVREVETGHWTADRVKHIKKYKSDDRHVCDVCARSKLTRTSFSKIHTIRGAELGNYISVDIAVFVNCESR
jgi:hypothetical protein